MKPFQQGTNSSLACNLLIAQFTAPYTLDYLNIMGFGRLGPVAALVGAGVLVAAPGLVAAPMLGVLGFGSLGPGAGTAAAVIQSLIGNVARGSFFAMLQSAGMGGAGAMALNAIISGIGLTGAALVALYKCLKAFFGKKGDEDGADGYDGGDDAK